MLGEDADTNVGGPIRIPRDDAPKANGAGVTTSPTLAASFARMIWAIAFTVRLPLAAVMLC